MSQASFKESPKKQQKPTNKSKEHPTLPWDRSYEESKKISAAQVTDHFKKKKPEKKHKPINLGELKLLLECANQIRENSLRKICLQTMTARL